MSKATNEALKEAARLCILAIIPVIITLVADLNPAWAGVAVIVLRAVDKQLHVQGVKKGLTQF